MKRLLIVSLRGGCGATTITANLAQALVKINKQVLAVDTAPENLLRLHFGLPYQEQDGWAPRMLNETCWTEAGYQSPAGADFLPFGGLSCDLDVVFHQAKHNHIIQLSKALDKVEQDTQWQLFHGQFWQLTNPALNEFVDSMDLVVIVLTTDPMNYVLLQSLLESNTRLNELISIGKLRFAINQYQPETEIGRDFTLVLKQELNHSLIPTLIHRDAALAECAANLTTVQQYSATSQAAKDFQALAFWCVSATSTVNA